MTEALDSSVVSRPRLLVIRLISNLVLLVSMESNAVYKALYSKDICDLPAQTIVKQQLSEKQKKKVELKLQSKSLYLRSC